MPGSTFDAAIRITHDVTQSIWLGGALMGATVLDTAASKGEDPEDRIHAVGAAWARWQRVSTPVIAGHLLAGAGLTYANKGRLSAQAGSGRTVILRTVLTGTALATEAASRRLGASVGAAAAAASDRSADGEEGTSGVIDERVFDLQRRLRIAQWANVAAVMTMIAVGSRMGEQQRPRELLRGVSSRLGFSG